MDKLIAQLFFPFFCGRDSLWRSVGFAIKLLWVISSPRLGDPAAFVEELPDDEDIFCCGENDLLPVKK